MKNKRQNNKRHPMPDKRQNLALKSEIPKIAQRRDGYLGKVVPKAISRARSDIASWKGALRWAENIENPKRAKLYNLYNDALLDAHLTAQVELRMQHTLGVDFILKWSDGKEADVESDLLRSARWKNQMDREILWSIFKAHSLTEFTTSPTGELELTLLPRNNVIPEKGILLRSEDDDKGIDYRNTWEYGTWILEFGSRHDLGLLNKAIPHALFKRFAQSCWSELCEIYGIPPRFIKTDTQDPEMLNRAETMLRDMGSAAYFIIDREETFEFAKGADTNGDVYNNLIALCNSEMSLLITGAVIGQDTKNGNRSKEESSIKLLDKIIQADKQLLAGYWNNTVLPALVRIGFLPDGLTYVIRQEEDLEKLWGMTKDLLPYKDIPNDWIKEKFGIDVNDKPQSALPQNLRIDTSDFFD